jgi:uncharacterized protein
MKLKMTRHPVVPALLVAAACVLSVADARAASFDCAKAATPTEHAICDNPQLSSLDEQTAGLYYTFISSGAPTAKVDQVKSAQASFLQKRDSCGANYNCLISAYTAQIMYLNAESGKGM